MSTLYPTVREANGVLYEYKDCQVLRSPTQGERLDTGASTDVGRLNLWAEAGHELGLAEAWRIQRGPQEAKV